MRASTAKIDNQIAQEIRKFFQEKVLLKKKVQSSSQASSGKADPLSEIAHVCIKCRNKFILIRHPKYAALKLEYCDNCIPF